MFMSVYFQVRAFRSNGDRFIPVEAAAAGDHRRVTWRANALLNELRTKNSLYSMLID